MNQFEILNKLPASFSKRIYFQDRGNLVSFFVNAAMSGFAMLHSKLWPWTLKRQVDTKALI